MRWLAQGVASQCVGAGSGVREMCCVHQEIRSKLEISCIIPQVAVLVPVARLSGLARIRCGPAAAS